MKLSTTLILSAYSLFLIAFYIVFAGDFTSALQAFNPRLSVDQTFYLPLIGFYSAFILPWIFKLVK